MDALDNLNVILAHDWLTGMRGGEKCLEVACRQWPDAELFTLLHNPGSTSALIEDRTIRTSFLQRFPHVHRYYRYLLPLMPAAVIRPLPSADLVVSFSHCVAKSVQPPPGAQHVCYCFTPMRYAWHMRDSYFGRGRRSVKRMLLDQLLGWLRQWDRATAERVTHFIAISKTVQRRIQECYNRDSVVIYPPVDTDFYRPGDVAREDFYLVMSAFAPYKRLDLAIQACNQMKRPLVVIGSGQAEKQLRAVAGPTVRFLGWQPDHLVRDAMQRCRALLFPGEEDFGIVPLEAQSCGAPVIAFGKGGASETIVPWHDPGLLRQTDPTGMWFAEQSVDAMIDAMECFEANESAFRARTNRRQAKRFNKQRFEDELLGYIANVVYGSPQLQARHAA